MKVDSVTAQYILIFYHNAIEKNMKLQMKGDCQFLYNQYNNII